MTLDEKISRVENYCDKTGCYSCKLRVDGWEIPYHNIGCLKISVSPEADLDRAIAIIEGKVEETVKDDSNDAVNHPSHYTDGKIEVIDFIEDKKLGFCLGNAVKYISRAGKKDPTKTIEDLKKAIWYVERRIKELEEGIE